MMKARLLSTVAATLLFAAGTASAQTMNKDEAPGRAPAAQQNAPAEKIAPVQKIAPALKTGERKPPETTGQASPEHKAPETTGQAAPKSDMDQPKAGTIDKGAEPHAQGSSDVKAKQGPATTGQGAAAGSAKLSTEQRTKITSIIRQHKVAPAHLNVSVSVGTRVPESVHFYPLPVEVIAVYPEWRGYDYILVGDEIVVIDPRTHEIVAILEA
jgi:hypothetical protein